MQYRIPVTFTDLVGGRVNNGEKVSVLLAEDSLVYSVFLSNLLESRGFLVQKAGNGREAIEFLESGRKFDVILSDLNMPEVNGFELAKYNFDTQLLPFIIITTHSDASYAMDLIKFGVRDYLVKPSTGNIIVSVVKNAALRHPGKVVDMEEISGLNNLAFIEIPSDLDSINKASLWVENKISEYSDVHETKKFINYLYEFLVNAHEHGNLGLGEHEKETLLNKGVYDEFLRCKQSSNTIEVKFSAVGNQVAVNITDRGKGFNYEKYLRMSKDEVLERITMPNGRGIVMAIGYFDSVTYEKNGASVSLVKKLGK